MMTQWEAKHLATALEALNELKGARITTAFTIGAPYEYSNKYKVKWNDEYEAYVAVDR